LSHIVEVRTEARDPEAVAAACRRLALPEPVHGETELFSGPVEGLLVRLPGWRYPLACDTATGELRYDNYDGAWGDPAQLGLFLQAYAVEKAKIEARRGGRLAIEQTLPDGSIRLTIAMGG